MSRTRSNTPASGRFACRLTSDFPCRLCSIVLVCSHRNKRSLSFHLSCFMPRSRRGHRSAAAELERAEKKSRLSAAAEKGLTYKQALEQEQIAQAQCNNSTAETGSSGVDALVPLVDAVDAGDTLDPLVEDALVEPTLNFHALIDLAFHQCD